MLRWVFSLFHFLFSETGRYFKGADAITGTNFFFHTDYKMRKYIYQRDFSISENREYLLPVSPINIDLGYNIKKAAKRN